MIKSLSAAALLAATLGAAPALAANSYDYRAQSHGDPAYDYNQRQENERAQYQEFNRLGCPPGAVVQVFPNSNGERCVLPGGGYSY